MSKQKRKTLLCIGIVLWLAVESIEPFLPSWGYIYASEGDKGLAGALSVPTEGQAEANIGAAEPKTVSEGYIYAPKEQKALHGAVTETEVGAESDQKALISVSNDNIRYDIEPYILSEEDKKWLKIIAKAEANSENIEGKIAVMQVVLNRTESTIFPDTVKEVVLQPNQFTTMNRNYKIKPDEDCEIALEEVMTGSYRDLKALFFDSCKDSWASRNRKFVCKIGNHNFYR